MNAQQQSQTQHNFSEALSHIRSGGKAARSGWNGRNMHVELHMPVRGVDQVTLPYLALRTPNQLDGKVHKVPWLASQTDLLADDWVLGA